MRYALFCRGGCERQTAYVTRPPGSTLKTKYFGFCSNCDWMIKWGGGVRDLALLSDANITRQRHLDSQHARRAKWQKEVLWKRFS